MNCCYISTDLHLIYGKLVWLELLTPNNIQKLRQTLMIKGWRSNTCTCINPPESPRPLLLVTPIPERISISGPMGFDPVTDDPVECSSRGGIYAIDWLRTQRAGGICKA